MNSIVNNSTYIPIDISSFNTYYSFVNLNNVVMENLKILLADDNDTFRTGLAEFVNNQYGFKVIGEANDGAQALNLIDSLKPDVVMLDVSMPKLDGISAARLIKKESPNVYVIMVTIHDEKVFKELATVIPVDGYISKSSISEELPKFLSSLKMKIDSAKPRMGKSKIREN